MNKRTTKPEADSDEAIGECWDTHDFNDYDPDEPDVDFQVTFTVPLEAELLNALEKEAKNHSVNVDTLVKFLVAAKTERIKVSLPRINGIELILALDVALYKFGRSQAVVQDIGINISSIRPNQRATLNCYLVKQFPIGQQLVKNRSVHERSQIHLLLAAVFKFKMHNLLLNDTNFAQSNQFAQLFHAYTS